MLTDTPSLLLWSAAGSPPMSGVVSGHCRLCGSDGIGQEFSAWIKDTFTNHDLLFPGEVICHACQFCCTDANIPLQERLGKDKPQRMRNYSHFVVDGEWQPLSKGDKRRMADLLMQEPTVVVIADSGQKHIIFRARCGWWQFEEQKLTPCPALLGELLSVIEPIYQAGASKAEIESGVYSVKSIQKIGKDTYRTAEKYLRVRRGGLPFQLAIFLAQKENDDE